MRCSVHLQGDDRCDASILAVAVLPHRKHARPHQHVHDTVKAAYRVILPHLLRAAGLPQKNNRKKHRLENDLPA
jgi:hypothetical protein